MEEEQTGNADVAGATKKLRNLSRHIFHRRRRYEFHHRCGEAQDGREQGKDVGREVCGCADGCGRLG
jgi:hypothetical protein